MTDRDSRTPGEDGDAGDDGAPETGPQSTGPAPGTAPLPIGRQEIPSDEPDVVPTKAPRGRPTAKGALVVGARGITGLVAVAVAVAAIIGATLFTAPEYRISPLSRDITPVAAAQQRVCPGPLLRLGDDEGSGASIASSVGRAAAAFQSSPDTAESTGLATTDNTVGLPPLLLTLPPGSTTSSEDSSPAVAGSQSQEIASGDLNGFAAAECAEPGSDIWLAGGATDVGRSTLITLSNPTTVIATVALTIYSEAGEVAAPGAEGIVIPPGAQRILSLAGFAPDVLSPVIRVQSSGGRVVANLQHSVVRTLAPGGVEIVGATRAPALSAVIPGFVVSGGEAVATAQSAGGFDDLRSVLRVLVPGDEAAAVTVRITPDSEEPLDGFELELAAGQVTDTALDGLEDGRYTVTVQSDVPVVVGVRASIVQADNSSDFLWLGAAGRLRDTSLASIAPGPAPQLHLVNPTDEDASVRIVAGSGATTTIELPAGEAASSPVTAGDDLVLIGTEGLLAAVTYEGVGSFSAFQLSAPGPGSTGITVFG